MIPFSEPVYYGNEERYLLEAFRSTWISEGLYNEELEYHFRKIFDVPYAQLTSNGTSALQLSFAALGLHRGDEVILPGFCFQGAANVAVQMGFTPVFVDVDPITWMPTSQAIREKITKRTRAIVIVHNYGYAFPVPELLDLKIPIIEDCAEAIFTKIDGQYVGTLGKMGTFSFHATKTLTTGEGGLVLAGEMYLDIACGLIKSHGFAHRGTYRHILPGNNFRMTNLQAAIGRGQLEAIDYIINIKHKNTDLYYQHLSGRSGITLHPRSGEEVLWSFPVQLDRDVFRDCWGSVTDKMKELEVETRPGFIPPSKLSYFKEVNPLPVSEELSESIIVLPLFNSLSEDDINHICSSLLALRSN